MPRDIDIVKSLLAKSSRHFSLVISLKTLRTNLCSVPRAHGFDQITKLVVDAYALYTELTDPFSTRTGYPEHQSTPNEQAEV